MNIFTVKKIPVMLMFGIFLNLSAYATDIIQPIFPNGDTEVSTAMQLTFQSLYPVDLPEYYQVSPSCYDGSGNRVPPKFYIIPTNHFDETMDYLNLYAVPCKLFISDSSLNLLTIVPLRPFDNGKSYTVVFKDFPVLQPNTSAPNGYTSTLLNTVFYDMFTTIGYPTHVADISFDKTGGRLWCANNDIVVNFNKPITPKSSVIQGMFKLNRVGDVINNPDGTVSYGQVPVPINVTLINGGMSAKIDPVSSLVYGGDYWLSTHFDSYLGNSDANGNYHFTVADEIIVSVDVYHPGGAILPASCRNAGFGGYRRYKMGDTAYLSLPTLVGAYYLQGWELPEGAYGEISEDGGHLKLIFDCNNFFRTAQGNAALAALNDGLKIRGRYEYNPIDTLEINLPRRPEIASSYPNYEQGLMVRGSLLKIGNNRFTFQRYGYIPLEVDYTPGVRAATGGDVGPHAAATAVSIVSANILGQSLGGNGGLVLQKPMPGSTSKSLVAAPSNGGNISISIQNGKVVIGGHYEQKMETLTISENDKFSVEIIIDGNVGREIGKAIDPISIVQTLTLTGGVASPTQIFNKQDFLFSRVEKIAATDEKAFKAIATVPTTIDYTVSLSNSDYEIYLVSDNRRVYELLTIEPNLSGVTKGYPGGDRYHINYSLPGSNEVRGKITADAFYRSNILKIHVRRKIMEYQFDVVIEDINVSPKSKAVPPFDVVYMQFDGFKPLELSERQPDVHTVVNDGGEYFKPYLNSFGKSFALKPDGGKPYYLRHDADMTDVAKYGPEGKACRIPTREKTSVYFYSGESFTATPYFKENSGYKFKKYINLSDGHVNYENLSLPVRNVNTIRKKESNILLAEAGFRLDYIGVTEINANQGVFKYFKIDDASPDRGYPLWSEGELTNPDKGVGMTLKKGTDGLHSKTAQIQFLFNKEFDSQSVIDNIVIRDHFSIWGTHIRPDNTSIKRSIDGIPTAMEKYPYYGDLNVVPNMNVHGFPTLQITLLEQVTPGSFLAFQPAICHLQPFEILINNPDDNPIMSIYWKDHQIAEPLSNIPPIGRTFEASTCPPGISIQNDNFVNHNYSDDNGNNAEVYLYSYTIADILNSKPLQSIDSLYSKDSLGRFVYNVDGAKRYPSSGYTPLSFCGNFDNTDVQFWKDILFDKQRLLHFTHWIDDDAYSACTEVITTVTETAKQIIKEYIGDTDAAVINIAIDFAKELAQEGICSDDDEIGFNHFWLVKDGGMTNFNNKYRISNCGLELFEQDWRLWGVGQYNMYQEVIRSAYDVEFDAELVIHFETIDANGTITTIYKVKPSIIPTMGTRIKIQLGDF